VNVGSYEREFIFILVLALDAYAHSHLHLHLHIESELHWHQCLSPDMRSVGARDTRSHEVKCS